MSTDVSEPKIYLAITVCFEYPSSKMAAAKKMKYPMEPLFGELRKDYCYVCCQRIEENERVFIGKDKWRHKKCKPGSAQWMKSPVSKEEHILPVFKT